jgi:hypothetical protein
MIHIIHAQSSSNVPCAIINISLSATRLQATTGSSSRVRASTDTGSNGRMGCLALGLAFPGLLLDLVFGLLVAAGNKLLEEAALLWCVVLV